MKGNKRKEKTHSTMLVRLDIVLVRVLIPCLLRGLSTSTSASVSKSVFKFGTNISLSLPEHMENFWRGSGNSGVVTDVSDNRRRRTGAEMKHGKEAGRFRLEFLFAFECVNY